VKKIFLLLFICTLAQAAFAVDQTKDFFIIPMLNYEYLSFMDQHIHSPGEGLLFTKGNLTPPLSESRNSLMIMGMFKQFIIKEAGEGYADLYHNIVINAEKKMNRHLFYLNVTSQATKPFYGLHTFVGMTGYGNELIRNKSLSLTAGGIVMVTDFDMNLGGIIWPIMPMPLIRLNVETTLINVSFEFLGNTTMDLTLLPQSKIRVTGHFEINPFTVRDIRDLFFDTTFWYRFFSKESQMGDIAGIGAGFKNSGLGTGILNGSYSYNSWEKGKTYELNYYSIYGVLDLSVLKISSGYSFAGREIYDKDNIKKIGNGFFINATLLWQF